MASLEAAEIDEAGQSFELTAVELTQIPDQHPVAVFNAEYQRWTKGHLLPHDDELLGTTTGEHLRDWMKILEPVEHKGLVDFYFQFQGDHLLTQSGSTMRRGWMSDLLDEDFVESRYHEAITASILRVPMFSRGAVPNVKRAYIMQYRGIFPMFCENRARLRLVLIAAETYTSLEVGGS